jgi:hypothetical protein
MQGNFAFANCLYILETDHEAINDSEGKTKPNKRKEYHIGVDDEKRTRPDIDKYLAGVVGDIQSAIRLKHKEIGISNNDVEDKLIPMECPSAVICEILCGFTGNGMKQRKYTLQTVIRAGYYCCYNLDFNVIQYDSNSNPIKVNRDIRFRSKRILSSVNAAIKDITNIFKSHATEAYIETVMSNGQTCYKYVTQLSNCRSAENRRRKAHT